ncbi:MAG: ABC transporter substrate-binding protein [Methylococcaceae bacterium]|jgi:NitT/TauT family transport system substrate-binding protein
MPAKILTALILLLSCSPGRAGETRANHIKAGVLAFGTLNWEITVMRDNGLDKTHHLNLETATLASAEAGKIALQSASVDIIVGDWIWVARQRMQGRDFVFAPYSTSHGALVVPVGSKINDVRDLSGKRLGIAGGGQDKNWLLLRAMALKEHKIDLDALVEKTFAAPPLLSQSLEQGRLDAVLTYWNQSARLQAKGYRQVLDGQQIIEHLGIKAKVPALGYIFRERWAKAHPDALAGFLQAATAARDALCTSPSAWARVAPLTQETDPNLQEAVKHHYCEGRITRFGDPEIKAASEIFDYITHSDGIRSLPAQPSLPSAVFWTGLPH